MENVTAILGRAFALSDESGNIEPGTAHGFYNEDTRFLSSYRLELKGEKLQPLSARTISYYAAAFYLTNHGSEVAPAKSLSIIRDRFVGEGLHDDLFVENHGPQAVRITISLSFASDFADIFEAKKGQVAVREGELAEQSDFEQVLTYQKGDFKRSTRMEFSKKPEWRGATAVFEPTIAAGERWQVCLDIHPTTGDKSASPRFRCGQFGELASDADATGGAWTTKPPRLGGNFDILSHAFERSLKDLAALRFPVARGIYFLAAGLPWFVAVFGRDSLITSLQTMILGPDLAREVLETLMTYQGAKVDSFREEEPGKIVHEIRRGELAVSEELPHSRYYGTVDATPLFLILVSECYRWTGDLGFVKQLLPATEAALNWIDNFGDLDKDGFVEYRGRSDRGLSNQGWKDSWDSTVFADGHLAQGPIALVEVQGYVYDARLRMAELYEKLGRSQDAARLVKQAAELKRNFEQAFWMPEENYLALALDGEKRQVDSITSNPGHCLYSGILEPGKAIAVAKRLLAEDMHSGWGVRTLSDRMKAYNPLSYHNGSVWPHDNAIIAAGLARYGFREEANKIIVPMLEAASYFPNYRLPELFAGFSRRKLGFPVIYPEANSPQAWAAGTPVFFLQTILGLRPDLDTKRIGSDPVLPAGVSELNLSGLTAFGEPHDVKLGNHR